MKDQDPYQAKREACLKNNGKHEVVQGHHICCADENVKASEPREIKRSKHEVQREAWEAEIEANLKAIAECDCGDVCYKQGTDACDARERKNLELKLLIRSLTPKPRYTK